MVAEATMFHVEHTAGGKRGRQADPARAEGAGGTTEARKPHRPSLPPATAGRAGAACRTRTGKGAGGRPTEPREPHRKSPAARAGAACRPRWCCHRPCGGGLPPPLAFTFYLINASCLLLSPL